MPLCIKGLILSVSEQAKQLHKRIIQRTLISWALLVPIAFMGLHFFLDGGLITKILCLAALTLYANLSLLWIKAIAKTLLCPSCSNSLYHIYLGAKHAGQKLTYCPYCGKAL